MTKDLWSLGCILWELYSGNMLFETHNSAEHLAPRDDPSDDMTKWSLYFKYIYIHQWEDSINYYIYNYICTHTYTLYIYTLYIYIYVYYISYFVFFSLCCPNLSLVLLGASKFINGHNLSHSPVIWLKSYPTQLLGMSSTHQIQIWCHVMLGETARWMSQLIVFHTNRSSLCWLWRRDRTLESWLVREINGNHPLLWHYFRLVHINGDNI
jgi:hypothetical protein